MNGLMTRFILIVIFLPSIMLFNQYTSKKRASTYQITEIDQPIMDKCSSRMSLENVGFSDGASNDNGCACIAKHATAYVAPEDLKTFSSTLTTTLDVAQKAITIGEDDPTKTIELMIEAEESYSKVQKAAGMSDSQYQDMVNKVTEYLGICGDRKSHKGESLTRIAALLPMGYERIEPEPASQVVTVETKKSDEEVVSMLRK